MKRTFVVLSTLALVCSLFWGYLAVAQDATFPDLDFRPLVDTDPVEQSKTPGMAGLNSELSRKSQKLVREYSRTEDELKRRELAAALRVTVDEHFLIKQRLRAKELADLEAKIRKLRSRHERRETARDRIVEDRVQQLLREADGLGWGSDSGGPNAWSRFGFSAGPVLSDAVVEELEEISVQAARQADEARVRADRGPGPRPPIDPVVPPR